MKNVGLIFAGGVGSRMNSKQRPKQFLELNGRAIIIHTLEYFERHREIDAICIVCVEDWIEYLKELLERYHFKKVKFVVPGGETGQASIYNGLKAIHDNDEYKDSIVLIHDGVRPLISEQLITDNILCVKENGSAITVAPAIETIVSTDSKNSITKIMDRKDCKLARAPQSFFMKDIFEVHIKAIADGNTNMIDSASLMQHYGFNLTTVDGPVENIKITTPMDFYLFRAIYEIRENSQIFGF